MATQKYTKLKTQLFAFALAALAVCPALGFQSSNKNVNAIQSNAGTKYLDSTVIYVGDKAINIPDPNSTYLRSQHRLPRYFNNLVKWFPYVTVHEIYFPFESNGKINMRREFQLATNKSIDHESLTQTQFDKYRKQQIANIRKLVRKGYSDLEYKTGVSISEDNKASDGIVINNNLMLATCHIADINQGQKTLKNVSVTGSCLVNGKIIMINVNSEFSTKADIEWVEKSAVQWMKKIVDANK